MEQFFEHKVIIFAKFWNVDFVIFYKNENKQKSTWFELETTCISGSYGTVVVKFKKMVAEIDWNSTWIHSIIQPVLP